MKTHWAEAIAQDHVAEKASAEQLQVAAAAAEARLRETFERDRAAFWHELGREVRRVKDAFMRGGGLELLLLETQDGIFLRPAVPGPAFSVSFRLAEGPTGGALPAVIVRRDAGRSREQWAPLDFSLTTEDRLAVGPGEGALDPADLARAVLEPWLLQLASSERPSA